MITEQHGRRGGRRQRGGGTEKEREAPYSNLNSVQRSAGVREVLTEVGPEQPRVDRLSTQLKTGLRS